MDNLFKGIQQVTKEYFNSLSKVEKLGYIWFVRESVFVDGEQTNTLGNDKYYIDFGSRPYGSFWEGEHEAMAASLNAIRVAVGLDENFAFAFEGATSVADAFVKVKGWYDALALEVADKADKADLAAFVADVEYADSKIIFKNAEGEELASVDAAPFIKDGMLSSVTVSEGHMNFIFNTDAGKETISIPLKDFFDPSLYYTREQIDGGYLNQVSYDSANNTLTFSSEDGTRTVNINLD
jgi:hypothetical protein